MATAARKSHPQALWIATTNQEVASINATKFAQLRADGALTVRIWAQHSGLVTGGSRSALPDIETIKRQ